MVIRTKTLGRIEDIFPIGTTDANGLWRTNPFAVLITGIFEDGDQSRTLLLVKDFNGASSGGDDIDADNDGVIDNPKWSGAVVDSVAVFDGGSMDRSYSESVLQAGFDSKNFIPGGASRIPNGTDTDSSSDWRRNDFSGLGLAGFPTGEPAAGEALNTPGAVNSANVPNSKKNPDGTCVSGLECIDEALSPTACAGANGFLNQINIATVVNISMQAIGVEVVYFDQLGSEQGRVSVAIGPNLKSDFIINDLGLKADTIGTVCVSVDTDEDGLWLGGITIYKPDIRNGFPAFGEAFDFALYYPFTNPLKGTFTAPVNTFHLGTNPQAVVANWLSIADAPVNDGKGISGQITFYDQFGTQTSSIPLALPDGGRADFAGHTGLTGSDNIDKVGMVRFVPDSSDNGYYATLSRYFYDCSIGVCDNMLAAFVIPNRPATDTNMFGAASTTNGEFSIIEINNVSDKSVTTEVEVYDANGNSLGSRSIPVSALGTHNEIVNSFQNSGYLDLNSVGTSRVKSTLNSPVSANSLFYRLNSFGVLEYAYAAPMVGSPGMGQVSEFNSFIQHSNVGEVSNTSDNEITVNIAVLSFDQQNLLNQNLILPPKGASRIPFQVPVDTFGTVILSSDSSSFVFRNYVRRDGQYVLSFRGQ